MICVAAFEACRTTTCRMMPAPKDIKVCLLQESSCCRTGSKAPTSASRAYTASDSMPCLKSDLALAKLCRSSMKGLLGLNTYSPAMPSTSTPVSEKQRDVDLPCMLTMQQAHSSFRAAEGFLESHFCTKGGNSSIQRHKHCRTALAYSSQHAEIHQSPVRRQFSGHMWHSTHTHLQPCLQQRLLTTCAVYTTCIHPTFAY